ncbi:MAG: phosphatase PAP2 family protein [Candidatus Sulfopaludibacter sp.]|nr:phosphatase PAP2 family protein [Candidatus Sulfopaludibacter sp.]
MLIDILTGNPFFASCLAATVLMLVWRWAGKERRIAWPHLLFPPFWSIGSTFVLGISASFLPMTLDRYLYAVDGSFGFQASFLGARLLLSHPWLLHTCALCYFNLPIAMTLIYLLLQRYGSAEEARRFIQFAICLAIAGTSLYFACPAVGPGGAFHTDFPNRIPQAIVVPVSMPLSARNCMPSMHTAWILCLLWCAPPLGRWFRAILWTFAGFTLLYALSAGGHYLVDLIVAVPFTLAVRAGFRSEWKSPGSVANAGLVVLWFVALRYGVSLFAASPAVPYGLTAISLLSPLWSRAAAAREQVAGLPYGCDEPAVEPARWTTLKRI